MDVVNPNRRSAQRRHGHGMFSLFQRKAKVPKYYREYQTANGSSTFSEDAKRCAEDLRRVARGEDTALTATTTLQLFATEHRRPAGSVRTEESLTPVVCSYETQLAVKCLHFLPGYNQNQGQPPALLYNDAKSRMRPIKFERKVADTSALSVGNQVVQSLDNSFAVTVDSGIVSSVNRDVSAGVEPVSSRSTITNANFITYVDSQCVARRSVVSRFNSFTENVLWYKLRPLSLALMLANNGLFLLSHRDQFAIKLTMRSRLEQLVNVPDNYEHLASPKQLKVRCAFCKRVLEVPFTTSFALAYGAEERNNPSYERMRKEIAMEKQTAAQWYIDEVSNLAALYAVASNVRLQHERRSPSCPMVVGVNADNLRANETELEAILRVVEDDQFYKRAQVNCIVHCERFLKVGDSSEAVDKPEEATLSESSVTREAEDAFLWTSYRFVPVGVYNDGLLFCSDDVTQLGSYIQYEMSGKRRFGDPTKVYRENLTAVTFTQYDPFPDTIYEPSRPSDSTPDKMETDNFGRNDATTARCVINRSDEEVSCGYESLLEHFARDEPCFAPFTCQEMRLETFEMGVQVDSKRISLRDYLVLYELELECNAAKTRTRTSNLDRSTSSGSAQSWQHSPDEHSEDDASETSTNCHDLERQQTQENMSSSDSYDDGSGVDGDDDRLPLRALRRLMGNTDWSADRRGLFERLADAGFLSLRRSEAELNDVCVCFWCGLAIGGWPEDADAYIEHARHQKDVDSCGYLFFQRGRQFIVEVKRVYRLERARTRLVKLRSIKEFNDADESRLLFELGLHELSVGSSPAVVSNSRSPGDESETIISARTSGATSRSDRYPASSSTSKASWDSKVERTDKVNEQYGGNTAASSSASSTQNNETDHQSTDVERYEPVVSFRTALEYRVEEREIRARKDLRAVRNLIFLCGVQPPVVAFAMERQLKTSVNDFANTRHFLEALWDIEARMRTARITDFNLFQRRFNELRSVRNVNSAYVQPTAAVVSMSSNSSSQNAEEVQSNEQLVAGDFSSTSLRSAPRSYSYTSSSVHSASAYVHSTAEELEQTDAPSPGSGRKCLVCHRNTANIVLNPCGHLVLCADCRRRMDICPQCNATIVSSIRIYT